MGRFYRFPLSGGVFIKGVYRGCADICVGILLAHNIKPISELFSCLRTWVIILLEVAVVAVSAYCIFLSNDGFSDILIVPAMCILIILCTSYRGIIHRFMSLPIFTKLGEISLYIYISQGIALHIVKVMSGKLFLSSGTLYVAEFAILITISIVIGFCFKFFTGSVSRKVVRQCLLRER